MRRGGLFQLVFDQAGGYEWPAVRQFGEQQAVGGVRRRRRELDQWFDQGGRQGVAERVDHGVVELPVVEDGDTVPHVVPEDRAAQHLAPQPRGVCPQLGRLGVAPPRGQVVDRQVERRAVRAYGGVVVGVQRLGALAGGTLPAPAPAPAPIPASVPIPAPARRSFGVPEPEQLVDQPAARVAEYPVEGAADVVETDGERVPEVDVGAEFERGRDALLPLSYRSPVRVGGQPGDTESVPPVHLRACRLQQPRCRLVDHSTLRIDHVEGGCPSGKYGDPGCRAPWQLNGIHMGNARCAALSRRVRAWTRCPPAAPYARRRVPRRSPRRVRR